ncbi:disease resistance protein RPP13-like [Rhododendron vialii]|uniref:disease resistance protein RPP13-like n=1 Tax=Rhododendron vialii TaxID=182163 RepID=UPI00265E5E6F|nr:disease resistance protein RPP13-like [Rhododendron vialii]XP_058201403.1 disease resistance protein RPP13-like [Rhododendron vialii]
MSDVALQFLLDNLQHLVVYNANLFIDVKDEVKGLIEDLEMLKAFIEDSAEKSRESKAVQVLVTNIRALTFEAEDAIDVFVMEASVPKSQKWLRKMFHGISHASKIRSVAVKVQTIRAKVKEIYDNKLYGYEALQGRDPAGRRRMERRPPNVEKDNVVGFDEATTNLIGWLTGGAEDLQVFSIIGMAGLGKTTLANKIYYDPRVSDAFSSLAWIYVSQTYTCKDLFLTILKSVNQVTSNMFKMNEDMLAEEVSRILTWKYLIVVDDVWGKEDWDRIKRAFPNCKNGSRILLTSRNKPVAVHANPRWPVYELDFLNHDQSFELLQNRVFGGECPQERQDLIPVGKEIAEQCNGLPLALVVIAGMLQNDISTGWWETVAKSVNAFLVRNEKELMEVLALSYYYLPPHLKACFLYFGVFPENYEIPVWILFRLLVAEGFVQKIENVCLEEMAKEHLEDLVSRSLVMVDQRSFNGRIKTCRIHDMLRDLCLKKATEENFLLEIRGPGGTSTHRTSAVSIINRRICIHSGVLSYISSKPSAPYVRSFLCFAKDQVLLPREHVGYIPEEFKLLRVFHIQPLSSPRFPSEILQLVHLTYVAFSGDFKSIPSDVSKLWNLQTLIVETTSRTIDVKADIWKMTQFRHLHTNAASQFPGLVAKKSESIQTLSTMAPESCTEGVLGQTPYIKKLGIRGKLATLLEEQPGSLFDNLTKLQQLVTLKLLNDVFPNPPDEFKLQGLPHWSKFPPNLKRLTLAGTFLEWEHMSVLGMLPKLEELKVKDNAFTGVSWSVCDGGFKKLKALQIWKTDLVLWEAKIDHFPILQHIVLKECTELGKIPSSLGDVETLRTIKLHRTSRSAADSARAIKHSRLKVDIFPPDL